MRILTLWIASAAALFAQSNAVTSFAFGPQPFVPSGRPIAHTAQFTVPPLVDGPYTLVVVNGNPDTGAPGVGTASISLNGVTLFDHGDFHRGPLQMPVTLLAQNTLSVEVAGAPGSALTIAIAGYSYEFASDYQSISTSAPSAAGDVLNWVQKGAVTNVKDQGQCQADWAFSSTGAVEGAVQIKHGMLDSLSEQRLIDCVPDVSICAHGSPPRAFQYMSINGDATSADYPYTARLGKCKQVSPAPFTRITGVQRSTAGDEAALVTLVNRAPVSVVVNGNWFSTYTGGIADTSSCGAAPPEYRAVLVVGYTSNSWIVKNSLGASWGEHGFFEIARGTNQCGIANYAIIPVD